LNVSPCRGTLGERPEVVRLDRIITGSSAEALVGFTAMYLIEPLLSLAAFLTARVSDAVLREMLLQPVVLANTEGGKTDWTADDETEYVKLVFLASLHEYNTLVSDEGFAAAFGTDVLSVELFDRWWSIRRLDIDNDTAWYKPQLAGCLQRGKVAAANPKVVKRLEWIASRVKSGNGPSSGDS
jgi:hypothetical protein